MDRWIGFLGDLSSGEFTVLIGVAMMVILCGFIAIM